MAGWLARLAGPRLQQMSQNLASSTHMDRTANLERSEVRWLLYCALSEMDCAGRVPGWIVFALGLE